MKNVRASADHSVDFISRKRNSRFDSLFCGGKHATAFLPKINRRSEAICCLPDVMLSDPNTTVPGNYDFNLDFESDVSLGIALGHEDLRQMEAAQHETRYFLQIARYRQWRSQ